MSAAKKLIARDGLVDRGLPCDALEWTLPDASEANGDNDNTLLDYHCPRTPKRRISKTRLSLSSRPHYSAMSGSSCLTTGKCANGVNDGMRGRGTDLHSNRKIPAGEGITSKNLLDVVTACVSGSNVYFAAREYQPLCCMYHYKKSYSILIPTFSAAAAVTHRIQRNDGFRHIPRPNSPQRTRPANIIFITCSPHPHLVCCCSNSRASYDPRSHSLRRVPEVCTGETGFGLVEFDLLIAPDRRRLSCKRAKHSTPNSPPNSPAVLMVVTLLSSLDAACSDLDTGPISCGSSQHNRLEHATNWHLVCALQTQALMQFS